MAKQGSAWSGRTMRRQFLKGVAAGAGFAALTGTPRTVHAATPVVACGESVQEIINLALTTEHLATTFYYTGLTTRAIVGDRKLAGSSANPNAISYNGDPIHVAYLQAALSQEQQHARILAQTGATSPNLHFYFPAGTFEHLGHIRMAGTFLWVVDHLETAFIGAYLAAIQRFGALKRTDLALLATRILGVECEHRLLHRVIAGDAPANNVTLEVRSFDCVGDAVRIVTPFLTGHGFPGGASAAIALPTADQTVRAIGRFQSE